MSFVRRLLVLLVVLESVAGSGWLLRRWLLADAPVRPTAAKFIVTGPASPITPRPVKFAVPAPSVSAVPRPTTRYPSGTVAVTSTPLDDTALLN